MQTHRPLHDEKHSSSSFFMGLAAADTKAGRKFGIWRKTERESWIVSASSSSRDDDETTAAVLLLAKSRGWYDNSEWKSLGKHEYEKKANVMQNKRMVILGKNVNEKVHWAVIIKNCMCAY